MKAPNTINSDEYAQMLFEACSRMDKKISNLIDEENSKCDKADIKGDEVKALKHYFNAQALYLAIYAMAKSPEQLKNIKSQSDKQL